MGQGWAKNLLEWFVMWLKMKVLWGEELNGALAISGKFTGVQMYIRQKHPHTVHMHYTAYSLNLDSCNISSVALGRNGVTIFVN